MIPAVGGLLHRDRLRGFGGGSGRGFLLRRPFHMAGRGPCAELLRIRGVLVVHDCIQLLHDCDAILNQFTQTGRGPAAGL